jgi:hypothetical protein
MVWYHPPRVYVYPEHHAKVDHPPALSPSLHILRHNASQRGKALSADLSLAVYFCLFVCGGVGIWVVRERIVTEADTHLADSDKIQRTMWSRTGLKTGEMTRAWRIHRRFFPHSSLRRLYVGLWIFTLSWMFLGLDLLRR